jgi:hypothetical protein
VHLETYFRKRKRRAEEYSYLVVSFLLFTGACFFLKTVCTKRKDGSVDMRVTFVAYKVYGYVKEMRS